MTGVSTAITVSVRKGEQWECRLGKNNFMAKFRLSVPHVPFQQFSENSGWATVVRTNTVINILNLDLLLLHTVFVLMIYDKKVH